MNWRPPRHVVAAAALVVMTTVCVQARDPGVRVDDLSATLVFGLQDLSGVAPLPAEAAVLQAASRPPAGLAKPRVPEVSQPDFRLEFGDQPREANPCPTFYTAIAPDREIGPEVDFEPPVGTFRWNRSLKIAGNRTALAPERRLVRNVQRVDKDTFRFETVQPLGQHFLLSTFLVKKKGGLTVTPPGGQVVALPRVREPESGISLKRTEIIGADGKRVPGTQPFAPDHGVLLLPIPVASEEFASVSVDRATGKSVTVQSRVISTFRINACGEPVDGWLVEAFVSSEAHGAPVRNYRWEYHIAPQYGGMLIAEDIVYRPDTASAERTLTHAIGQVDPDPPPASLVQLR